MNIHIYRGSIDELTSDILIIPYFCNERPLKSIAGLIDWRLNGKLSRLIMNNIAQGEFNEKILFSPKSRLKIPNFFLFGLGLTDEFSLSFYEASLSQIFTTIENLNAVNFSIPIGKFLNNDIPFKEAFAVFLTKLAQRKKECNKLANDCFVIIRHEDELKELAIALKRLNGHLPIDMNIEVITNI